jgi:hypothetical protein
MTNLFNLCELNFQFYWRRLGKLTLPTFKVEIIQGSSFGCGRIEFTWDISQVDISIPVLYSEYVKTTQEVYDYYWAEYNKSVDPDDIPF